MRSSTDKARVLAANLRGEKERNFLRSFQEDAEMSRSPAGLRYLNSLWTRFEQTVQGRYLRALEPISQEGSFEKRLLVAIRTKLEAGKSLLPSERDRLEEHMAFANPTAHVPPAILDQVERTMGALAPIRHESKGAAALCDHMQRWLRKQGRR